MRLLISASDASTLLALTSAALSSVTEMLPPPSLSSTLKASWYDMLGARPDCFEKPTLFMTALAACMLPLSASSLCVYRI